MRRPAQLCHDGKFDLSSTHSEGEVMSIVFVGIDLAKNVFALHGVNAAGAVQLRQSKVERTKLNEAPGRGSGLNTVRLANFLR